MFLVPWLDSQLINLVNSNLHKQQKKPGKTTNHNSKPLDSKTFLRFLLRRMVHSLIKHQMHSIKSSELEELSSKLMGVNRHDTISPCMSLEPTQVEEIFAHARDLISSWVALGTVYCIDESIFPFFGRVAFEKGLLQLIPNKPHDYGLVTYYVVQRLLWTNLPIAIDLEPTWINGRPTPLKAATALLLRNRIPNQHQHLIADNLWSPSSYFSSYSQLGIYYTLSMKPSSGDGLKDLMEAAGSGLPNQCSRTFTRGDQALQVVQVEDHTTTVISNAWTVSNSTPSLQKTIGPFKGALDLFKNYSLQALCDMFSMDHSWLLSTPERVIFEKTGWDVLRPENQQDDHAPLDYTYCQKLKKAQLLAIYKQRTKLTRTPQSISKKQMLEDLFGDESSAKTGQSKVTKRKHEVANLAALRAEVAGSIAKTHSVYDIFHANWNDLDRINKDYHSFYYSPGHNTEMKQGLESEIFMMMMVARAIYEEHLCVHAYASSGNKKSAVPNARRYTIPMFIIEVAKQLVAE
jgi:hypothetical protein